MGRTGRILQYFFAMGRTGRVLLYLYLFIGYLIGTMLTVVYFAPDIYRRGTDYLSLQLVGVILGSIFLGIFLIMRSFDKPIINKKNAKIYFDVTITILGGIVSVIVVIFTILYGSLYPQASFLPYQLNWSGDGVNATTKIMGHPYNATEFSTLLGNYTKTLIYEGITLILITVYAFIVFV